MLIWPNVLMPAETEGWTLSGVTVNPGVSTAGISRRSRTEGGGLWTCQMSAVEIWTPQQLHLAEAMKLQIDVGITPVLVARFNQHLAPVPEGFALDTLVGHSDGSSFSDGGLYPGGAIVASLAASAALRATTLQIEFTLAAALLGGEPFSIDHAGVGKRLYGIAGVWGTVGGVTTVTIRPPLREAVASGTPLDFDDPGCVMSLVNEDWLSPLDASHEQTAAPVWVEYFDA